jgi:hypothetical protein
MVSIPVVWWVGGRAPQWAVWLIGGGMVTAAVAGMGAVAVREYLTWLPGVPTEFHHYLPHRIVFVIATMTDIPFVQVLLSGIICWTFGVWRNRSGRIPSASSSTDIHADSQGPDVMQSTE